MLIRVLCEKGTRAQHAAPGKSARRRTRIEGARRIPLRPACGLTMESSAGSRLKGITMRLVYLGVFAATFPVAALAAGDGSGPKTSRTPAKGHKPQMQPSTPPSSITTAQRVRARAHAGP